MTPAEELKEKVLTLQTQLLEAHPQMPLLLRQIHTQLRADPELVTTLAEEDIGIIVQGLAKQQMVTITTAALKKTSTTKSLKKLTVNDL